MKAFGLFQLLVVAGYMAWALTDVSADASPYVWGSLLAAKAGLFLVALLTKGRYRWPALLFAVLAVAGIGLVLWHVIQAHGWGDAALYTLLGLGLTYGLIYGYMDRAYLYKSGHLGWTLHNGQWVQRIGKPPEFPTALIDLNAPLGGAKK